MAVTPSRQVCSTFCTQTGKQAVKPETSVNNITTVPLDTTSLSQRKTQHLPVLLEHLSLTMTLSSTVWPSWDTTRWKHWQEKRDASHQRSDVPRTTRLRLLPPYPRPVIFEPSSRRLWVSQLNHSREMLKKSNTSQAAIRKVNNNSMTQVDVC